MKIQIILALILVGSLALPPQTPVIGIVTLPDQGDEPTQQLKSANYTYIAASYVKFVQMSGAQVVPIFAYNSTEYLDDILSKVNGVLFTGGGIDFNMKNKWTQTADHILKYAIDQNKNGNPYPVWGTCLGFELLVYLTSGYDDNCLVNVRGQTGMKNTIQFVEQSYIYSDLSSTLKYNLQNGQGILYFNHALAVKTDYYYQNSLLKAFWKLTSISTSPYNEQFVSTVEGKDYPIFAVQFHPEKNLFEWKVNAVRSDSGAQIVQIMSNKFVDVARKNKNTFSSDAELRSKIIYNYKPQFTTMSFIQVYLFQERTFDQSEQQREMNLQVQ